MAQADQAKTGMDQLSAMEQIAKLQRVNASLERHAKALSHDLRGPIASTISGLKLLSQYGDRLQDEERREILDRSVTRLSDLVQQMDLLLDEATIDSGARRSDSDLGLALQWVLTTLDREDEARLTTVIEEVPRVLARRVALRQILQNVVSNTLHHNEGPVALFLSAASVEGRVHIHLDDDGVGFPDNREGLLADGVSGGGSTGLGMATIAMAMERLGGELHIGDSPTGGARVTLVFDAAPDEVAVVEFP